jgi:hypothetical protein
MTIPPVNPNLVNPSPLANGGGAEFTELTDAFRQVLAETALPGTRLPGLARRLDPLPAMALTNPLLDATDATEPALAELASSPDTASLAEAVQPMTRPAAEEQPIREEEDANDPQEAQAAAARAAEIRAGLRAAAAARGVPPPAPPMNLVEPGGMTSGVTVSLAARGTVKVDPGVPMDRTPPPAPPIGGETDPIRVDRAAASALALAGGNAAPANAQAQAPRAGEQEPFRLDNP